MKNDPDSSYREKLKEYATYAVTFIGLYLLLHFIFPGDVNTFSQLNLDKINSLPSSSADNLQKSSEYKSSCRWESCFDIFNCTKINIYLYPLDRRTVNSKEITPAVSKEFYQLYKSISSSPYYTENAENACLKIAPYDVLSISTETKKIGTILHSLPNWNHGKNFLFFNLKDLDTDNFPIGEGLIASSDLKSDKYRFDFDLPISFFSSFLNSVTDALESHEDSQLKSIRKFDILIVGHQPNHINYQIERIQKEHYLEYNVLAIKPCVNQMAMCDRYENIVQVPEVFRLAKYCIITKGIDGKFQSNFFAASLGSGCVPIVAADDVMLPFFNKIDWPRATIRVSSNYIDISLIQTLNKITESELSNRRSKCVYLYNNFFSSMEKVFEGTMASLNDRILPHMSHPYEFWNGPLEGVRSPIFLDSFADDDGFTSIILAYERIESLYRVIEGVAKAPSLKKVIVIWNNQHKIPPPIEDWPQISVPIVIIKTTKNALSNRFFPYDEIETDCVLSIDDDIVMLTPDEIEFGYQTWREFPDRLVGYPPRLHVFDEEKNEFVYNSEWTNEASIILTGASFYHKYYQHAYSHLTPAHVRDWVDEHMNCEDILMNFVIANCTGKAPIKVSPRKKFKCLECSNQNSISIDPGHMVERSECINYFTREYGHMPLKTVQFRADPVLYKDDPKKMNKESVVKKFEDIGPM